MQQDLALATARQQAVETAIQQFQKLGQQFEQGWKGIEAQANGQQELAAAIVNGASGAGGTAKTNQSITELSAKLAEQAAKSNEA